MTACLAFEAVEPFIGPRFARTRWRSSQDEAHRPPCALNYRRTLRAHHEELAQAGVSKEVFGAVPVLPHDRQRDLECRTLRS